MMGLVMAKISELIKGKEFPVRLTRPQWLEDYFFEVLADKTDGYFPVMTDMGDVIIESDREDDWELYDEKI